MTPTIPTFVRPAPAMAVALLLATAAPALASDYLEECSSADGGLRLSAGELTLVFGEARETPPAFEIVSETVLKETLGYCLSDSAGDQRFPFERHLTLQRIRFEMDGQTVEDDVLCLMIGDGLPAALGCDREVITSEIDITTN